MMHNDNLIWLEYEKQRMALNQEFYNRVANLHNLALKAMEDTLSLEAPLANRFQAAKFLYEIYLQQYCTVAWTGNNHRLVDGIVNEARSKALLSLEMSYLDYLEQ